MYIWRNLKTIQFYLIKLASTYSDNQAIYWVKYTHLSGVYTMTKIALS